MTDPERIQYHGVSDPDQLDDLKDDIKDAKPVELRDLKLHRPKEGFFKGTALGRTLSLRNRTGRRIAGTLVTAVGAYTGINLGIFESILPTLNGDNEMELLQSIWEATGWDVLISAVVTLFLTLGVFTKAMKTEFMQVWQKFKMARLPESKGGTAITNEEKGEIYDELVDFVEVTLAKFGIPLDLNQDGTPGK